MDELVTRFYKSDVPRFFRYTYTGFLMVALVTLTNRERILPFKEVLPVAVMFAAIIAGGACIFILYRYVLGELILFNLALLISWGIGKRSNKPWSVPYLLGTRYQVRLGERRAAYTFLRRSDAFKQQRERIEMIHSEIHVLYVTAFELLVLRVLALSKPEHFSAVTWTAFVVFLAGIIFDVKQHRDEATFVSSLEFNQVNEELRKGGFSRANFGGERKLPVD